MKPNLSLFSLSSIAITAVILMFTGCKQEDDILPNQHLLSGKFSVAEGKQVSFTKGNLYWDGTDYHFEASQTAYAGPANGTSYNANHVGHFFWTSNTDYRSGNASYMPHAAAYLYSDGQTDDKRTTDDKFFCGEDNKITVDGQSNLYALTCGSEGEWTYLFRDRTNALNLYKKHVTVNGIPECIIIAPDDFTGTLAESYDASAWDAAEALGLVCLPPAGYRNGADLYNQGSAGGYWSSTPSISDKNCAYGVYFPDPSVFPADYELRGYGLAIRLVSTVSN